MKKLLYILLIVFSTGIAITSCTEENVTPTQQDTGGGGGIDPKTT
jgi:hypothetical protein